VGDIALRGFDQAARGLFVVAFWGGPLPAAAATELVSHRAVYDLELSDSQSSSDLAGLSGRMVVEWSGSTCNGYTLNQRLVTRISDTDGGQMVRDLRMTSWESGDGDQFRFEVKRFINGQLNETVSGLAARDESGAEAVFSVPEDTVLSLPDDVVFPSEFIRDLVSGAEAAEKLLTMKVFEGAETDKHFDVSVFIGNPSNEITDLSNIEGDAEGFSGDPSWPVQVSYFLPDDLQGLPDYQVSYRIFANGVSANMLLDYGDVVVSGTLKELEFLSQDPC
jgi:envelope integrity protein B